MSGLDGLGWPDETPETNTGTLRDISTKWRNIATDQYRRQHICGAGFNHITEFAAEVENWLNSSGSDLERQLAEARGKAREQRDRLTGAARTAIEVMEAVDGANDCSRGIRALDEALAAVSQ